MNMRSNQVLMLTATAVALSACSIHVSAPAKQVGSAPPPPIVATPGPEDDPRLVATLYQQQAVELRRLSAQAYALAALRLPHALKQPGSSALEQADGGGGKPPAAIFDVDETVLDNSPFQARSILGNIRRFHPDLWDQWIGERAAAPMAGAVDFVRALRQAKVRVVYITNRECRPRPTQADPCPQHADTLANLNATGLGPVAPEDLMLKGQNGWPSEKAPRRIAVAATHRIIMSLGDQFSDMMSVTHKDDSDTRRRIAAQHQGLWDSRWIIIPNPTYGYWLDVLPEPQSQSLRP